MVPGLQTCCVDLLSQGGSSTGAHSIATQAHGKPGLQTLLWFLRTLAMALHSPPETTQASLQQLRRPEAEGGAAASCWRDLVLAMHGRGSVPVMRNSHCHEATWKKS